MTDHTKCYNKECGYNSLYSYWLEIDSDGNALAADGVCWAYYLDDRPAKGNWILVREDKEV